MPKLLPLKLIPIVLMLALAGCFTAPTPPDDGGSGGGGSDTGGPRMMISSPEEGAQLSGASYFSVQAMDESEVDRVDFSAGDQVLDLDADGENKFRRFLIPADYSAGELEVVATAHGKNGKRTTRSVTVEVVHDPPSSKTLGGNGGTVGDFEESGALSTLTLLPGTAEGSTLSFETRTQQQIKADTGVDYEALGVTFLGAQQFTIDAEVDTPLLVTSGGFGPQVQPGQTVVNYAIVPDGNGDGNDDLTVLNTASVAPNGDVVSDPVARPQVSDTVVVGTSGAVKSLGAADARNRFKALGLVMQSSHISGPPGTSLSFEAQGFNAASPLGNKAIFCPDGTDLEYESYGMVSETGSGSLKFDVAIPPLPPGPATLKLRNESTGFETEVALNVEAAPSLSSPAAEIIDGHLTSRIADLLAVRTLARDLIRDEGIPVNPDFMAQLDSLLASFSDLRDGYRETYASSDPDVQDALEGLAAAVEQGQSGHQGQSIGTIGQQSLQPQVTCSEGEALLSDALDGIMLIDATLTAGACVTALATAGGGAPLCVFGATVFIIGTAIDYTDIVPDCGEDEPPPPFGPPGGGSGSGGGSGGSGGNGSLRMTGMGAALPLGGNFGGNVAPGAGGANTASLGTSSASSATSPHSTISPHSTTAATDFAGRYRITVYTGGSPQPFTGVTDAGGYFFSPLLPAGQDFLATAVDTLTGESRDIRGVGPAVGEGLYVTFDFSSSNIAPSADAGVNQSVKVGDAVSLDGNASSDPDGDELSFSWSFTSKPGGSTATLENSETSTPSMVPDIAGDYVIELTVDDGIDSNSDSVTISASEVAQNSAPIAQAGSDQTVNAGQGVTLDGSGSSDPDGDDASLTYLWSFLDKPVASSAALASATSATASFTADAAGTYSLQLEVSDGEAQGVDTMTVTAESLGTPLSYDETAIGSLDMGEVDSYVFDGNADDLVVVTGERSGSSLDGDVTLSLAAGTELDTASFAYSLGVMFVTLPETGQYVIDVAGAWESETGGYQLGLYQPSLEVLDSNLTGEVLSDERAFYAFNATAGQQVKTKVLSADDGSMASKILDSNGDLFTQSLPKEIAQDGQYLVMIEPWSGGSYVAGLAEIQQPTPISFGASASHGRFLGDASIDVVGDEHYYLVDAIAGDGIHVSLSEFGGTPIENVTLELKIDNGTVRGSYLESRGAIGGARSGDDQVFNELGTKLPSSGSYLIRVDGRDEYMGGYQLRVDLAPGGGSLLIDDDGAQCPAADSKSLPAALFAVDAGGQVTMCDGFYQEVLTSYIELDNIILSGASRSAVVLSGGKYLPLQIYAQGATVENLTIRGADHSSGNAVMIASGGESALFDTVRIEPHTNQASLSRGINGLENHSTVRNSVFVDAGSAIDLDGASGILITGNQFLGLDSKIYGFGATPDDPNASAVTVSNNTFDLAKARSISLTGGGHQIVDNTLTIGAGFGSDVIVVNNMGAGPIQPTLISGNTVTVDNSSGDATVLDLSMAGGTADLTIERNRVDFGHADGGRFLDIVSGGPGTVLIRNNVATDLMVGRAFEVGNVESISQLSIINNSMRAASTASTIGDGFLISLQGTVASATDLPVTIANNILVSNNEFGIEIPANATIDADFNLFFDTAGDYSGGTNRTGGNDKSGEDPLFADFDLLTVQSGSPAVNAGAGSASYSDVPAVDYSGNSRPQSGTVDIGAHEQ
ncbi:MAG: PKD domain-containing protein [Trueperaceae bacterium]